MRKLRKCTSSKLYTGVSKCPPDFGKMKAVILVKPGTKLPADLTADKLEEMVHADPAERAYGIVGLCEYAKSGSETQTAVNGYGPEQVTGISARKDTFDLEHFYPELDASLAKTANAEWDAYYLDDEGYIYGIDDGTDALAGYPMSCVYGETTPIATSSSKATMQIVLCHKDAKLSKVNYNYERLGFKYDRLVLGILPVELVKTSDTGSKYKLIEPIGGNDITPIYGPLIATAGTNVIVGTSSAVTYDEESETLTIAVTGDAVPRLAAPKTLYEKGIKGIEQV